MLALADQYLLFPLLLLLLLFRPIRFLARLVLLALLVPAYLAVAAVALVVDVMAAVVQHLRGREEQPDLSARARDGFSRVIDLLSSLPDPRHEVDPRDLVKVEQLLALSPTGFEVAVGDLLRARGCTQVRN